MKRIIFPLIALAWSLMGCQYQPARHHSPTTSSPKGQLIGTTPTKDQGKSELCWAYAMLSTIESEHIMRGDSVNLSVAYIARMMLSEKAIAYYLTKGKNTISMRGTMPMLLHYMQKYGIVPYDSYEDPKDIDYRVLCRKVEMVCRSGIAQRIGIEALKDRVNHLLDEEMGYMPAATVHMLGAEYTRQEFAHSVCYPQEYRVFTSFTHHPFFQPCVLEIPDNQLQDSFYNIPIDNLMGIIDKALRHKHPVCWEGDISEPGFAHSQHGFVDVQPRQLPVTQASRQNEYERLQTTDDHVMSIVGYLTHDKKKYYLCRNSWGKEWGLQGYIYLSEDYLRLKTIAIALSKEAL